MEIHGQVTGEDTRILRADLKTHGLVMQTLEEQKSHEGLAFVATDYDASVDAAGPKLYRVTTPNTTLYSHLRLEVAALTAGLIEIYETPTQTGAGTGLTAYNLNRNSSGAATLVVAYDMTVSADGTRIWFSRMQAAGAPIGNSIPIVLKANTTYLVKFTSDGNGNKLWISFVWVEHTDLS